MKIKLIHVDDLAEARIDLIIKMQKSSGKEPDGYYPLNKNAKAVAKFIEKDTLTGYDVRIIRELGHDVEFVPYQNFTTTTN